MLLQVTTAVRACANYGVVSYQSNDEYLDPRDWNNSTYLTRGKKIPMDETAISN